MEQNEINQVHENMKRIKAERDKASKSLNEELRKYLLTGSGDPEPAAAKLVALNQAISFAPPIIAEMEGAARKRWEEIDAERGRLKKLQDQYRRKRDEMGVTLNGFKDYRALEKSGFQTLSARFGMGLYKYKRVNQDLEELKGLAQKANRLDDFREWINHFDLKAV